jgi:hypothetical protein
MWLYRFGTLAGQEFTVTGSNIEKIETHLQRFSEEEEDGSMAPQNEMMLDRLKTAFAEGRAVYGADASFYFHELHEASLMDAGIDYPEAHSSAFAKYGVSPFSVYAPEVVQSFPELFNSHWLKFWDLGGES